MKILIISSQKEEWNILSRLLKLNYKNVQLSCAINHDEAINYTINEGPFSFTIIDVDNKEIEPDQLCREIIDFAGNRPFIFLGSQGIVTHRLSQDVFNSTEFNDTLLKPLERDDFQDDLSSVASKAVEHAKKEEYEASLEEINPDDFIPMKLKGFFLYNSFPYDLYLEITPTRYLKAISKNESYALSTLTQYARKGIRFLHIKKDDQLKYLEDESHKCLKSLAKEKNSSEDLILICLRSFTLIHQSLITIGMTPTVNQLTEKVIDCILEVFSNKSQFSSAFKKFPHIYSGIASKSLLTSFFALIIAKKMGWDSDLTKRKLVFAALLHDHTLPVEEMSKINSANDPKLSEYSEQQIEDFLAHPLKSSEVAKQFSGYSDIDFVIENHHETPNRKGFPNKPSHTKLTSLCSVFNIAQFIAAEVDGFPLERKVLQNSIRLLQRDYNSGNFKDPIKYISDFVKTNF